MVLINNSWLGSLIDHLFACMGGCFGCETKPALIIALDDPTKGLMIHGKLARKPSVSEDWWSTSTFDLDYFAVQSQRSLSSISALNSAVNNSSGTGSTNGQIDFVNYGLNAWNENRLQWVGSGSTNQSQNQKPMLSWNATYETLLLSRRPFPQPIPLSEAIDLLVDVWDQEGLYE